MQDVRGTQNDGGAVRIVGGKLSIVDSRFVNCEAQDFGAKPYGGECGS